MSLLDYIMRKKQVNKMSVEITGAKRFLQRTDEGRFATGARRGPKVELTSIFQDERLYESVLAFATRQLFDENLLFLKDTQYRYSNRMTYIVKQYIETDKPKTINISTNTRTRILELYNGRSTALAAQNTQRGHHNGQAFSAFNTGKAFKANDNQMTKAINSARREIINLMETDALPRYACSDEYEWYLKGEQHFTDEQRFW